MSARRRERGFTLVEMAVVTAIILVVMALAWSNMTRQRPRARLATATAELQSLIHGARQSALSRGHPVAVMVFPQYAGTASTGRVVVLEDRSENFFQSTSTLNFDNFSASATSSGADQVLATYDLPTGIVFGPSAGMGAGSTLTAPLDAVNVATDCSFCGTSSDRRGAIRFDTRGRAAFFGSASSTPASAAGGSLSLTAPEITTTQQRTVVILPATGTVRTIANG
jgi:prepilin-type N-terminal cleavage/methylation domain-containing protein